MPNRALIREASLKASGADIHDVNSIIWAYEEACNILAHPRMRRNLRRSGLGWDDAAVLRWATAWRKKYETYLYAYVTGTSMRELALIRDSRCLCPAMGAVTHSVA
jgi:hypothetical protein